MKKLFVFLMVSLFTFSIVAQGASIEGKKNPDIDKKNKQLRILEKFEKKSQQSRKELKMDWNEKKGIPSFITGDLSEQPVQGEADAVSFLNDNKDLFNIEDGNFVVERTERDNLGTKHYRTKMLVDGIPVYGSTLIVHTDSNGNVYSINGQVDNNVPSDLWNKRIKINEKKAEKAAEDFLGLSNKQVYTADPTVETYLYNFKGEWQVVDLVTLQFINPYPANYKIFVNAESGNVIDSFNACAESAATGTGVGTLGQTRNLNLDITSGVYSLKDLTRGAVITTYNMNNSSNESSLPGTLVTDSDNNFNSSVQAAAVDAHYYIGLVYDYYKNNFSRNSYDNAGAAIKSSVHFGSNYNNAYWNGSQMVYGDGDGTTFKALSGAIDVVGHEFTHAVTEKTANLEYRSQSGALNESISDCFGYLIEGDPTDWQMGEDCYTPNTPGDALRDLRTPTLYNQPDNMSGYVTLPETDAGDWGGVHTNSGIPNKAFYLVASTINNNAKTANIYYRALTTYLTSTSQFVDMRNALLQAATDLYGANGTEYNAVANAFTQVGITGATGTDPYEPNNSTTAAYGPITSGTVYNSYIYSSSDVDYYYFNTAAAGTITVNLSNLPKDYDLYLLDSSGTTVAKSENGSTTSENISYSSSAAGKYYVKVVGYSGAYSTSTMYALKATYPTGSTGNYQWYYGTASVDTPHNYANNYNNTYTYTKAGAQKVSVHFSRLETEAGYDFVYIKDKAGNTIAQYDGTKSAFWAQVDGDTINVNIVTDGSVTAYGYHIDQVGYYSDKPLSLDKPAGMSQELLDPASVQK